MPTTALYTAACTSPNQPNPSALAFPASVTIVATIVAFQSAMTDGSVPALEVAARARAGEAAPRTAATPATPAAAPRRTVVRRLRLVGAVGAVETNGVRFIVGGPFCCLRGCGTARSSLLSRFRLHADRHAGGLEG